MPWILSSLPWWMERALLCNEGDKEHRKYVPLRVEERLQRDMRWMGGAGRYPWVGRILSVFVPPPCSNSTPKRLCWATGLMSSTVHMEMFPYVSRRVENRLFRSFQWLKEIKRSNVDVTPTRSRSWRTQEWRTNSAIRQMEVERSTKNQADGIKSLLFLCFI